VGASFLLLLEVVCLPDGHSPSCFFAKDAGAELHSSYRSHRTGRGVLRRFSWPCGYLRATGRFVSGLRLPERLFRAASSSLAKKAEAALRISLARRSSQFSFSSSAIRCWSLVVIPGR
jgi:hypothetical protein